MMFLYALIVTVLGHKHRHKRKQDLKALAEMFDLDRAVTELHMPAPWNAAACFAADSTIFVENNGEVEARKLSSVIPGIDKVLSRNAAGELYFDSITALTHRPMYNGGKGFQNEVVEITFEVDGVQSGLHLTETHWVRMGDGTFKESGDVVKGDEIVTASGNANVVDTRRSPKWVNVLYIYNPNDEFLIAAPGVTDFNLAAIGTWKMADMEDYIAVKEWIGVWWIGSSRQAFCKLDKPYDDCWALDEWILETLRQPINASFLFRWALFACLAVLFAFNWTVIIVNEYVGVEYLAAAAVAFFVSRKMAMKQE